MSLQELWELFPITLVDHNAAWKEWAVEEIQLLATLLCEFRPAINHIGSTAIPGIKAKLIVDILVEIPEGADYERVKSIMEVSGYICMAESVRRMSFNKGYTPAGYAERVFHVHIHRVGDNDEVLFRDYLLCHPDTAKEYEQLKLSLLPAYRNNRDAYTAAKSSFIINTVALSKSTRKPL